MSENKRNRSHILKNGIIQMVTNNKKPLESRSDATSKRMEEWEVAVAFAEEEIEKLSKEYALLSYVPSDIKNAINETVIGQEDAVSKVVHVIYSNIEANLLEEVGEDKLDHTNLLLVGPSGCGKNTLFWAIKEILNFPVINYNADTFTSTGWVGGNVENVLIALLKEAKYDLALAERGVIFINEIDKKRKQSSYGQERDINGQAVQEELLKLLEPNFVDITLPDKSIISFDTSRLTIIMMGAFVGLDKIKKKRLNKTLLGFKDRLSEISEEDIEKEPYLPEDFIKYGFIPEFVGRALMIEKMRKLEAKDILRIIYYGRKSIYLQKTRYLANVLNVEQQISNKFLENLAKSLSKSDTGVRDLNSKIENLFYPIIDDAHEHKGEYGMCFIDEDGHYELMYDDVTYYG